MDLHPLLSEHPSTAYFHEGTYEELISAWLRHVEAGGSRVVVLPPCPTCNGRGVIGGDHHGATAYHCPDCTTPDAPSP